MKKVKRCLAFLIALVMCAGISISAMAHTITVSSTDTHEYKVFQVLKGTLADPDNSANPQIDADHDRALGNPEWGADATAEAKATDVNDFIDAITAEGLSEQDIAQLVAEKVDTTTAGQGTVKAGQPLSDLATGYYVLVDVTELEEYGDDPKKIDTKSLHVVRVVNNIGFSPKYGTTEDKKIIKSDTLGTSARQPDTETTDNVSIGDTVDFQITATIPENANLYNYFYFVINDTLDEGLTLNEDSIAVYKDSVSDANKLAETTDYLLKTGDAADPKSFEVGLVDAKSLAGKDIIVTYSAVLNENAKIGEVPNKNTSTVTFSNDPNHDYNGENNPGFPDETDRKVTGETPITETKTFTTGIEIQKVDESGQVLTGAEFTITGDSAEIVLVSSETFAEAADGEYYGLKNGTYTKQAPVEEDSMEEAAAGATKGYVEDASATGDDVVEIGGKKYRPYVPATDEGKTIYILVKANADQYDGKQYNKTVTYTQKNTKTQGVTAAAEVGADGVVRFVGLGAGEYTITESKTPAGYNTIDPFTVTISFTADPAQGAVHWSKASGDASYNSETGVFEITVENNKGTELPETGGMGTTIFYILGSLLVVGAGVVLVARRRMSL